MQTQYKRISDDQWQYIKKFVNWKRKRELSLRDVFDAIFWITRTGSQWRNLPECYPKWSAVYYYFEKWTKDGTLKEINMQLNMAERKQLGRESSPSLLIVDSQSVKLAPMIYEDRGIDGNKKVNGRKRQILVDVLGRLWFVHVHAANRHDSPGGLPLLDELEDYEAWVERLEKIMADKSYRKTFGNEVEKMELDFEVPQREEGTKGFVVEAKRWVVERSFAWLNYFRRVVIDYEHTTRNSESFLLLANMSMIIWRIDFNEI